MILTALSAVKIAELDVFGTVEALVANPASFGLDDVTDGCITPTCRRLAVRSQINSCSRDGVHPTKAVQAIFAEEAAAVLGK